ncbi:hypothetical protein HPB49_025547 [Dermacentor silvarum]|uniref:Uncharacterized protein n=1 Tax=Dermacentor silvarum TaxID=543639 RepID=A0ACB8CNK3_DERSI|nr:hypothetical protein HPB49_025547 [Dermacentor silvarum]
MQQQPDSESSPPRRASPAERPRGESKQRDSSRKRDDSKIGRSASRRRPSQSRERGSWADAVKANMAEKRQPPAQNAAKKIQEANGVEKSLRDENEKLKRRIAEQDTTIKEINEKRKQEMTEDEPEVEVHPRATIAAGPAPKRRAIEGAKERKITEKIEKQGDRLDHLEATSKVTNERLTALEQTVQQMTTNIQSTIQNMIAQMQTQLQAHIQAQMQTIMAGTALIAVTTPPVRDLLVWHWNCNGFTGKRAVLLQHLQQQTRKPDVIMIQETHSEETPRLPGYGSNDSPPSERDTSKGKGRGVCTFVRKGITFMEHELIGRSAIEHCTVEVITGKKRKESTFLVNVYSNPSHGQQKFKALLHKASRVAGSNTLLRLQRGSTIKRHNSRPVQQVSAALGRQRPSETEDKGGGTPRKGAVALSDPRK